MYGKQYNQMLVTQKRFGRRVKGNSIKKKRIVTLNKDHPSTHIYTHATFGLSKTFRKSPNKTVLNRPKLKNNNFGNFDNLTNFETGSDPKNKNTDKISHRFSAISKDYLSLKKGSDMYTSPTSRQSLNSSFIQKSPKKQFDLFVPGQTTAKFTPSSFRLPALAIPGSKLKLNNSISPKVKNTRRSIDALKAKTVSNKSQIQAKKLIDMQLLTMMASVD